MHPVIKHKDITQEIARQLFEDVGHTIKWRKHHAGCRKDDLVVSANNKGYLRVQHGRKKYCVHRVLYIMRHGDIPEGMEVDHINRNTLDNTPSNLRLVTAAQNASNKGIYKRKYNLPKGVHMYGKKFIAYLVTNKQRHCSPVCNTPEQAAAEYANLLTKFKCFRDLDAAKGEKL